MESIIRELAPYLAAIIAAVATWFFQSHQAEFDEKKYYQELIREAHDHLEHKLIALEKAHESLKARALQLHVENRQLRLKLKDHGIDPDITI